MDWEANLAAIIRCTDENLQQQFRHFEDITTELSSSSHAPPFSPYLHSSSTAGYGRRLSRDDRASSAPSATDTSANFATTFLRDTMGINVPRSASRPAQVPTTRSRSFRSSPVHPASSFAKHFRQRQEQKREEELGNNQTQAEAVDQQQPHDDDDYEADGAPQPTYPPPGRRRQQPVPHVFSSPTYDIAQMMEQVRLSLKLEVDARAAIAERQLSALLNLCKSTSEELDRLRVEVCANDRQLHTIDQTQSKIRQELTTQKDIGFHLQSMCGKDESWRMQAENQLLELRQLVAALREQCNNIHTTLQEKLTRSELVIQFNAAMEPIKGSLHANMNHQAQQIAEITRSTSTTSLLLDALSQKVNKGHAEEIAELRNELYALKHHVQKSATYAPAQTAVSPSASKEKRQLDEEEKRMNELCATVQALQREYERQHERDEELLKAAQEQTTQQVNAIKQDFLIRMHDYTGNAIKNQEHKIHELHERALEKQELALNRVRQEVTALEHELTLAKSKQDTERDQVQRALQHEVTAVARELSNKMDQLSASGNQTVAALVDAKAVTLLNRVQDFHKELEAEQKERKKAIDDVLEEHRRGRHALEDRLQQITLDTRSKWSDATEIMEKKQREVERSVQTAVEATQLQERKRIDDSLTDVKTQLDALKSEVERQLRAMDNWVPKNQATATASLDMAANHAAAALVEARTASIQSRLQELQKDLETEQKDRKKTVDDVLEEHRRSRHALEDRLQQMALDCRGKWSDVSEQCERRHHETERAMQSQVEASQAQERKRSDDRVNDVQTQIETLKTDNERKLRVVEEALIARISNISMRAETAVAVAPKTMLASPPKPDVKSLPAEPDSAVAVDITAKIQQTLAASTKGAQAEAELAKQRVENRRKQEQEQRQLQQTASQPKDPATSAPTAATASSVPTDSSATGANSTPRSMVEAKATSATPSSSSNSAAPTTPPARPLVPTPPLVRSLSGQLSTTPPPPAASSAPSPAITVPRPRSNSLDAGVVSTMAESVKATPATPTPISIPSAMPLWPDAAPSTTASPKVGAATPLIPRPVVTSLDDKTLASAARATPLSIPPSPRASDVSASLDSSASKPATPSTAPVPAPPRPPTSPPPPVIAAGGAADSALPSSPRIINCEACRLPVRAEHLAQHEQTQCIRRKVACHACKQPVLWSELLRHEQSECSAKTAPSSPANTSSASATAPATAATGAAPTGADTDAKKCRHCSLDVPAAELVDHESKCDQVLKQCPHCLRRQKMSELQEHIENCDCRLVPCPNDCGGKFLQRGVQKHLATRCSKRGPNATSTVSTLSTSAVAVTGSVSPVASGATATNTRPAVPTSPSSAAPSTPTPTPPAAPTAAVTAAPVSTPPPRTATPAPVPTPTPGKPEQGDKKQTESAKVECKFCDDEFSSSAIESHEATCDWKPRRCQHCNMVIIARDLARHEGSCKSSAKSCPHCLESMPPSALLSHTSRCSKRPIKCIRCCQLFPADSIVAHSTSCKFVPTQTGAPAPPSTTSAAPAPVAAPVVSSTVREDTNLAMRIPPPPPYPPSPVSPRPLQPMPTPAAPQPRPTGAGTVATTTPSAIATGDDASFAERMARRSLALSQLTSPSAATGAAAASTSTPAQASANRMPVTTTARENVPENDDDDDEEGEEEEEEEEEEERVTYAVDDDEDDDDEDADQLTLAQVVAEWSVENVCLWLQEDVGVPEVAARFAQRQCNGEMLLELTESDLINDLGIKNRLHRERILTAIEAIKSNDDYSDEDDEDVGMDDDDDDDDDDDLLNDDDDDDEDDDLENESRAAVGLPARPRTAGTDANSSHPRELLRRNSMSAVSSTPLASSGAPGPSESLHSLPSSSAMLRRINSALSVQFPDSPKR